VTGLARHEEPMSLADVLERVLDKGLVIAGDIRVNLLDIELLTIKIRLLLVSVDKAAEMGIDWWRTDPMLSSRAAENQQALQEENARLRARLEALESGRSADEVGSADGQADIEGEVAEDDTTPQEAPGEAGTEQARSR
jgi:hypothetical protein